MENNMIKQDPVIEVTMDGITETADSFVAIFEKEDGKVSLRFNTDTVFMGFALKALAKEYFGQLDQLSDEDRIEVEAAIDAFDVDKLGETADA